MTRIRRLSVLCHITCDFPEFYHFELLRVGAKARFRSVQAVGSCVKYQLKVVANHWSALDAIGRANDPVSFHLLDQAGGPVVPNPQPALQHRS